MRVAVIGGGIAGLSAAARLAQHAEVTVFEAEAHLGYHTSGRSAAMYEENYGNAAVRALNRASKDWFETSGVLSPRGIMLVALEAEISLFETDLADMGMEELSLAKARARVPILSPSILRAAIHEGASDIDTGRVLDLFARSVTEAGGRIVKSAEVVGLSRREGGWRVETREGAADFDVVVNAAGAWADRVAALAGVQQLGLQP
jgi:glycine/D-amino acid oxidase-like deaminating enzyme